MKLVFNLCFWPKSGIWCKLWMQEGQMSTLMSFLVSLNLCVIIDSVLVIQSMLLDFFANI